MSISKVSLIKDAILRKFENVTPKDSKLQEGVLAVMRGIAMCSEVVNENNRWYPRSLLYSKILNNDEINHLIQNNALIGEGCHPEDRFHTVYPNAAILIKRLWIPDDDPNNLWIDFWILDTPVGRIINTLLKVGSAIGISARAAGTAVVRDGIEYMNEDDYTLFSFDCVPDPGFRDARPIPVYEHKLLEKKLEDYDQLELNQTRRLLESLNPYYFKGQIEQVNSILESMEAKALPSNEAEAVSLSGDNSDDTPDVITKPCHTSSDNPDELFEQLCSVKKQIHALEKLLESERAKNSEQGWKELPVSVVSAVQQYVEKAGRLETHVAVLSECKKLLLEKLEKARCRLASQREAAKLLEDKVEAQNRSIRFLESKCASIKSLASDKAVSANEMVKSLSAELSGLQIKLDESQKRNYALSAKVRSLQSAKDVDSGAQRSGCVQRGKNSSLTSPVSQPLVKSYESQISYISAKSGVPLTEVRELIPKVECSPDSYVPILLKMAQFCKHQPKAVAVNESRREDSLFRLIASQRSS